jgi:hypothetical protein
VFPALGAGGGEVQVLDDHGMRAVLAGRADELADPGAYARVAGGGG